MSLGAWEYAGHLHLSVSESSSKREQHTERKESIYQLESPHKIMAMIFETLYLYGGSHYIRSAGTRIISLNEKFNIS